MTILTPNTETGTEWKACSMAGPTASAKQPDLASFSLPAISPIHSTPSKKSSIRKRLPRIGLPFSSSEDPEHEYLDNGIVIDQPFNNYTPAEDQHTSNSTGASLLNRESASSVHAVALPNMVSDTASSNAAASNNISFSKSNTSTSSLANSVTTPTHKLPYKASSTNLSSTNVPHPKQQQQQQQQNSTAIPSKRSDSLSDPVNSAKSISFHHTSSPNKPSSRYLATNNDHTFLLTRGNNNNQQHPILPTPQILTQKPSHSQTNSVNYVTDDSVLSSSNSSTNNNNSTVPKIIPLPYLPQFTPVNQGHHQSQNSNAVLVPPTVLTPAYKTHSSSTQGTGQQIYTSANNSSVMYSNHNNESNSQTVPSSDTNSTASRQKRGTGLLQNAYRSSHQSHSNLANSKNKEGSASAHNATNSAANTNGKSDGSYADNMNCLDSKHHFISPKVFNQFKSLQHLIQLGIRKRLEYLDDENSALLSEINNYYDEIDNVQKQLSSQVNDLDGFIATLTSRKEVDLKNLQQHGLFENLNDLNTRIETVKGNMDSKKESLKIFEAKLNTLAKLKINNENRNRYRKHITFVSCLILAFLFLVKLIVF